MRIEWSMELYSVQFLPASNRFEFEVKGIEDRRLKVVETCKT